MAFDGIVLHSLTNELNSKILGAKIDKIYQPERDEIVLQIRNFKDNYKLFLSADPNYPRIHLTDLSFKNPDAPPLFCMLLRKHIGSGKIVSISQVNSDRILKIGVDCYNEFGDYCTKYLIIEIMGRHSNIILVDERNVVVDSVKHIDFTVSSKRQLLPGLLYELPPPQDKLNFLDFSEHELKDKILMKEDILADKFMMNTFNGISPIVSREVCFMAFHELNVIITKEDVDKKVKFFQTILEFLKRMKENEFSPNILFESQTPKYFSSITINQYGELYKREDKTSPSEMVDLYYRQLHFARKMSIKTQELSKTIHNLIDKISKKIAIHQDTILNSKENEMLRLYGELLTANIYLLKGNESKIKVNNYYTNEDVVIPLDKNLSPSKNIQKYFKAYQRSKTAMEKAKEQLVIAQDELYYLEGELNFLNKATTQEEINDIYEELIWEGYLKKSKDKKQGNKKTKSSYLTFKSSDDYDIIVGKNNKQNDEITFKLSKGNDLWLHVKTYPGSHTLIKSKGEEIPDRTILEAAQLAAYYSKDMGEKVTIDYTLIKYVKKPPGAKPGMVTYTNFKSVVVDKKMGIKQEQ